MTQKKLALTSLFLSVVAAAGIIFWLQSDNEGQIKQPDRYQKTVTESATKVLDGQFMTFEYPGGYFPRQLQTVDVDLELYQLDASTPYTKKINASVTTLPDGTLNSNSAYLLRKNKPDLYRQRSDISLKDTQVWASFDNTEQTVFITRNNQAAILAFKQDGGDLSALNDEVDAIIQSFKWK